MMFLFNWVIFRFQPFIFRGVDHGSKKGCVAYCDEFLQQIRVFDRLFFHLGSNALLGSIHIIRV